MADRISFIINGEHKEMEVDSSKRLLDFLREDLSLTGTKEGCGVGECGACTVLFNSRAIHSCMVFCGQIEGAEIVTVEGLQRDENLHPLQKHFLQAGAVQCGFCTPGMLMSAYGLLLRTPCPSEEEIRTSIAGNLCRCTGYSQIVEAIRSAGEEMKEAQNT